MSISKFPHDSNLAVFRKQWVSWATSVKKIWGGKQKLQKLQKFDSQLQISERRGDAFAHKIQFCC